MGAAVDIGIVVQVVVADGIDHHQRQEQQVDSDHRGFRHQRQRGQQTADSPHQPQQYQWQSVQSFRVGPVAYGGEQKAGDGRIENGEQHFMLVPA